MWVWQTGIWCKLTCVYKNNTRRRKTAAKQIYRTFRAVHQYGFNWTYFQTKSRLHARATVCDNRFFVSYCLRFEKLNVSSKAAIEILEKFFECLETRYSILEPRTSMLDSFEHRGSSFESRLSTYICTVLYILKPCCWTGIPPRGMEGGWQYSQLT